MRTSVRRRGNSAGIIPSKPVLAELGVKAGDDLSLTLEKGRVVLTPAKSHPRLGWAEAAVAAWSGLGQGVFRRFTRRD